MSLKVFGQIGNALTQQRYLHFWRTGIGLMRFKALDNFLFPFSG
jgi:hypothetical protein